MAAVATVTFAAAVAFAILRPRWPGMLLAMIIGSGLAAALGGEAAGLPLVGQLAQDLPPLSAPDTSLGSIKALGSAALAVANLGCC